MASKMMEEVLGKMVDLSPEAKREVLLALVEKLGGAAPINAVSREELPRYANDMVIDQDVMRAREILPDGTLMYCRKRRGEWQGPYDQMSTDRRIAFVLKVLNSDKPGCLDKKARNEPVLGAEGKKVGTIAVPAEHISSIRVGYIDVDDQSSASREAVWVETTGGRSCFYDPERPSDEGDVHSKPKPYMSIRGRVPQTPGYSLFYEWNFKDETFVPVEDTIAQARLIQGNSPAVVSFDPPVVGAR